MDMVKQAFPLAPVTSRLNKSWYGRVIIYSSHHGQVVSVPQRDLYRKYNWPARPVILEALMQLKHSC